jgi:hypothetical protein
MCRRWWAGFAELQKSTRRHRKPLRRPSLHLQRLSRNRKINDEEHNIHAEVDVFLENGTRMVAVEVKAKLQKTNVDGHVKRIEKLREYADLHGNRRDLFGALATEERQGIRPHGE